MHSKNKQTAAEHSSDAIARSSLPIPERRDFHVTPVDARDAEHSSPAKGVLTGADIVDVTIEALAEPHHDPEAKLQALLAKQ